MEIEFFLVFIFSSVYIIFTLYQIILLSLNFNKIKLLLFLLTKINHFFIIYISLNIFEKYIISFLVYKLHLIFSFIFLMILIFYSKKIKDYKDKINFFIIVMDSILTLNYYLFLFKIDIFSLIDRML